MPALAPLPSYDENQLDTVLRECPECKRTYFMRPWHHVCVQCRGWLPVAKQT
jgi:hypothetical protein